MIEGSDGLIEVVIAPADALQLWDILRLLRQVYIMKHLFVHERLVDVWIRNSDKDDSSAKGVWEVDAFTCLSAAYAIQDSFVSVLNMLFV